MTETKTYNFSNASNYTYGSEIDFTNKKLKLQEVDLSFTEDFADDIGFTYDNTKAEFVGDLVQQKDQRPVNATFGITYTTNINGNWGNGVLTGIASGGASVSGGKLNLKGGTQKYVTYDAIGNAPNTQIGCIKFKYTPNYSGSPIGNRYLFDWYSNPANDNNSLQIYHASNGNMQVRICDNLGNYIYSSFLAAWVPVTGIEYEFEFNFDFTTGSTRLFINGIQIGSTIINTGTRTAPLYLRIGAAHNGSNSDGEFNDIEIFSTVQHISNYTSGYAVSENIYIETSIILPEMEHIGDGSILAFNAFSTTEVASPRYTLQIGRSGNYLYWNGSAWVTSDGTYSQANDKITFNTNCISIDVNGEKYGQFKIIFPTSNTLSSVSELTANMRVNNGYLTTNPTILCLEKIRTNQLLTFTENITKTGLDQVKYILMKDTIPYYWSAGWIVSSGVYAQSNTAADILANCASFTSDGIDIYIKIFLHSNDGTTTPILTSLIATYEFYPETPTINVSSVYGILRNLNTTLSNKTIEVYPSWTSDTDIIITSDKITTTTSSDGYWEINMAYENSMPTYLYWNIDGKQFRTNCLAGNKKFSDLTNI
jgi:hypothetical protein